MKKLLFILPLLTVFCVHAQENNKIQAMATALDSLRSKAPVEKVHIQFDKPFYVLGDTLWMKAYVTDEQGRLSLLSNILQADLVDDRGVVKASLHLPLTEGLGWGSIALTDSLLSEGNYHVRAYTTLMRNYDNAYFFDKEISIGNTMALNTTPTVYASTASAIATMASAATKAPVDTAVRVQFFPEGGSMVDGLPSVVAFKALGPDGLGRNIAGYIADKDNQHVADFHSEHAGMGTFVLIPEAGNAYTAIIKMADGTEKRFNLQRALPQGYVLSVSQNADKLFVRVLTSNSLLKTGTVTLVAQAGNSISYSGSVTPGNPRMTAIIPKNGLPGGIVQLTLFSQQFDPLAERLVFIRKNDNRLNIKVTPDKPAYKQRDKVHLGLEVTDSQGKPVSGAFSLAITGEGKVPYSEVNEKTIFSDLLLSGDLKGYIEHPNYYFTDTSAAKAAELDNLLLTQGWRRFVWKDILINNIPTPVYASTNNMGISGQVLNSKGKPAPGAKVFVLLNTKGGKVINTEADAQGRFRFDRISLPKGLTYIVSATDAKGKKKVTVNIDKAKEAAPPAWQALPNDGPEHESLLTYIDSARKQNIAVRNSTPEYRANANMTNKNFALKEVQIREKKKDEIKKIALRDSQNPARNPDFDDDIFTFVDLDKEGNVGAFLSARALGLRIKMEPGGWTAFWEREEVPVMVNGRREAEGEYSNIMPSQIAAIEIIQGSKAGNHGASNSNASINITLKANDVNYQKYIDEDEDDKTEADAKKAIAKEEKKKKAIELRQVDIREKRQSEVMKIALKNSSNIAGPADKVLTFLDMQKCVNFGACLAGRLGTVQITFDRSGFLNGAILEGGAVMFVVDGKKIGAQDKDWLKVLTPEQIASVEVIEGARAHIFGLFPPPGRGVPTGVIVITTKSGEDYQKYIDQDEDDQTETSAKAYAARHETKNTPVIRDAALSGSKNLAGPGHANTVLTFADLAGCGSDLKGCLVDNLPGIKLKDRPLGGWEPSFKGTVMKVYVDGVETGASTYSKLAPATIAAVEAVDNGDPATLYHGPVLLISLKKTDVDYDAYLEQHKKEQNSTVLLKEIEIKAKKLGVSIQDMAVKHSQNLAGAGHADQVVTFVDLLGCQSNLSECLQGRLTNIVFQRGADGKLAPYSRGFDKPMLVVIDGVQDRSLDDVISSDVSSVEVLRGGGAAALYGMHGANGVMIITTKTGDVDYDAFSGNFRSVSEKPRVIKTYTFTGGYDLRREFYSPDYDNPATNKQLADLRTTIYWAPNIITDKDGKASMQFFNSDDTGGYRIIAEGLDGQGKLGRQVGRYTVK